MNEERGSSIDHELRLEIHRRMLTIRLFEEKVTELIQQGLVRGAAHSYVGMEGVAVGACMALRDGDWITSTHRGHGHCLAKGSSPERMFAELMGRSGGYCRGKGGSMHITDTSHGMLGADGIVAGSTGIAVGAAFGERLRGSDAVVACFFGDGAINQGLFHEAANLAAVLGLGVVFVCENNQWALSTPLSAALPIPQIASRAAAYGFPGVVVDGNDPEKVLDLMGEAVDRARSGGGPTLVEAETYRLTAHSAFSSSDAREPAELEHRWNQEPIERHRRGLIAAGVSAAELDSMRTAVEGAIQGAARRAAEGEPASAESALEDVYAPASWNLTRGG